MVIDGDFSCAVDIEKGGSSHVHPDFRVSENEKKHDLGGDSLTQKPAIFSDIMFT